jgi:hypothetical protein
MSPEITYIGVLLGAAITATVVFSYKLGVTVGKERTNQPEEVEYELWD